MLKAEYSKSGRNASVVKMKMKNLLTGSAAETVYQGRRQVRPDRQLDKKEVHLLLLRRPDVCVHGRRYNQYEVEAENMGDALSYLEDGMPCEVVFYDGKAISVELPNTVVREVIYTEPAVKGDTSGKVMKPAKRLATGFELPVPAFVDIGDKIEIDTRTNEYRARVKVKLNDFRGEKESQQPSGCLFYCRLFASGGDGAPDLLLAPKALSLVAEYRSRHR